MKVSVIIPVYNVERYLVRCLDSVLAAADGLDCELVCVNDGSTDGSADILRRYADRVRIITKANGGLGSARNAGLDVATGDYILFVDSDDWIPPQAISTFVSVADASKASLAVSTSFMRDDGGFAAQLSNRGSGHPAWRIRKADWISGKKVQYCAWNKFYRRDLFAKRRYPATIYEDFPVTTDIFREVGEFAAVDEPLYVYCTNAGATSLVRSAFTLRKMRDSLTVVRLTLDLAKGRPRETFSLRQAADGLSSTVGQVSKSGDATIATAFLEELDGLLAAHPGLRRRMSLKARWRLWRLRQGHGKES